MVLTLKICSLICANHLAASASRTSLGLSGSSFTAGPQRPALRAKKGSSTEGMERPRCSSRSMGLGARKIPQRWTFGRRLGRPLTKRLALWVGYVP